MCASSLNKPSSQEGLKNCPFCGGEAEFENLVFEAVVRCKECYGTLTRAHEAKTDTGVATVKAAWNTRHPSFNDAIEAWQPIETAPKDGTEINGYRSDQGVFTFRWAEMSEFVDEGAIVDGHDTEFAWWWHDRWGWMEKDLTPTHWQPLPTPPRSLKLPDYRGGEAKTAESGDSPSTLNAETE